MKTTQDDLGFLTALHDWISRGLPAGRFAAEQGVSPSTVTYRLNRFNLTAERAVGLLEKKTKVLLPDLIASGELAVTVETPPTAAVPAVA